MKENKFYLGKLLKKYYEKNINNVDNTLMNITINNTGNITIKNFYNPFIYKTSILIISERELECAILYNANIKIEEIRKIFSITKTELNSIFKNLHNSLLAPNHCSKKYISNRISEYIPYEIKYKVLERFDLVDISKKRNGLKSDNSSNNSLSNFIKESSDYITFKNIINYYCPKCKEIEIPKLYIDILSLIASGISTKIIKEVVPETRAQIDKVIGNSYNKGKLADKIKAYDRYIATDIAIKNNIINDNIINNVLLKYKIKNRKPQKFEKQLKKSYSKIFTKSEKLYENINNPYYKNFQTVFLSELELELLSLLLSGISENKILDIFYNIDGIEKLLKDDLREKLLSYSNDMAVAIAYKNNIITEDFITKVLKKYNIEKVNRSKFNKSLKEYSEIEHIKNNRIKLIEQRYKKMVNIYLNSKRNVTVKQYELKKLVEEWIEKNNIKNTECFTKLELEFLYFWSEGLTCGQINQFYGNYKNQYKEFDKIYLKLKKYNPDIIMTRPEYSSVNVDREDNYTNVIKKITNSENGISVYIGIFDYWEPIYNTLDSTTDSRLEYLCLYLSGISNNEIAKILPISNELKEPDKRKIAYTAYINCIITDDLRYEVLKKYNLQNIKKEKYEKILRQCRLEIKHNEELVSNIKRT